MKDFLNGMQKWPLLLGAVLCFMLAIYEETITDDTESAIATTGAVVGSILLGAWLVLYVIDVERHRHLSDRQTGSDPSPCEDEGSGPTG